MAKLQLNTGVKNYEIEDENGKILGTISIYPSDFNLAKRTTEAQEKIKHYISTAETLASEKEDVIEEITELDNKIKEQLDYMFNSNVSETVFGNLHCLDINPGNGEYFIKNFLDVIIPVIESEMKKAIKKNQQQVSKYTSQVIDE